MKKIILVSGVVLLLASSSCSVVQKTSSSLSLRPEFQQIPTLYELEVSPNAVSRDTSWTSGILSTDKTSLMGIQSIVTAQIIEAAGSDVLVEPKVSVKTVNRFFATDYKLTISGYPAT